jgi:hypothetical protein
MTLIDSAVQTSNNTLTVALSNPAGTGTPVVIFACPVVSDATLSAGDSPLFFGQLRGYTK